MTGSKHFQKICIFTVGLLLGLLIPALRFTVFPGTVTAQDATKGAAPDLAAMQADIAHLKEVVPSQSHSMTDVGYQFANLWFAGERKNWPLAEFFLNESRQHIEWTIRIRPVRKNPDGGSVDLRAMFEGISDGALKDLGQSIVNKNQAQFNIAYKNMLEACYACHRASAKPFLRPMVPKVAPQTIINFDPDARWPE